ncbi:hypothetical protein QCE73_00100 [Caballeronia sp. LZ029]|uniref:hypothetical protein n=1 Tax=Caballeronia sp. LZ029 TaxID=3038564 RepID=UPI002854DFD9|nr:hypothetical protein [Caballeronia sp. LZ029]MDR5741549.1 hypothetical protein [Caballeronia sp. LZ029]
MLAWISTLRSDLEPYWEVIVAAAVPIAAVVGFLVNWGSLKKVRLENRKLLNELAKHPMTLEKLQMEVEALREERGAKSLLVKPATWEEMIEAQKLADEANRHDTEYARVHRDPSPRMERIRPSILLLILFLLIVGFGIYQVAGLVNALFP